MNNGEPLGSTFPGHLAEHVEAALQGLVVGGVGDAEVGVAAAEDVAGDDQQVAADRLGDELGGGAPGGAGEGVEGPLGKGEVEALGERGDDRVALAAVGVDLRRSGPASSATTPAYWTMLGAQTKLNCWSLAISWISRAGPWA